MTVMWEWTGQGGAYTVVDEDGAFEGDMHSNGGAIFAHTFDEAGIYKYVCESHRSIGMKGAVVVE